MPHKKFLEFADTNKTDIIVMDASRRSKVCQDKST